MYLHFLLLFLLLLPLFFSLIFSFDCLYLTSDLVGKLSKDVFLFNKIGKWEFLTDSIFCISNTEVA